MVPADISRLRIMPHAEAHVTVSPHVKALIPIVVDGPDEGGMIQLDDLFMVMLNGQYVAPKAFPLQLLRTDCTVFTPIFVERA